MGIPIFKNFLDKSADFFGLRVVDPRAMVSFVDIINEEDRICGQVDGIDSRALKFNLRFYTDESPYINIINYKPIIYHTIERVTRTAMTTINILASTFIGVGGFMGMINPMAPVFVLISVIITIVSFALFLTSTYFDNKFQKDVRDNAYTTLKALDRESWNKIKSHINMETRSRLEGKFEAKIDEGKIYVPSGELSVFLTQAAALDGFVRASQEAVAEVARLRKNRITYPINRNSSHESTASFISQRSNEWVEMTEFTNSNSPTSSPKTAIKPSPEKEWTLV